MNYMQRKGQYFSPRKIEITNITIIRSQLSIFFTSKMKTKILLCLANEIYRRVQKREEEIESRVHVVFPPPQLRPSGAVGANGSNYKVNPLII